MEGGETVNVRKPIDYGAMFAALDALMAAELQQMELYYEIGRLVSARPEKGAAVAAAEYLCAAYPNASGFSPRNLRRMREFYRTYESVPEMLAQAMTIGWTKTKLSEELSSGSHKEAPLDIKAAVCYTGTENRKTERTHYDEDTFRMPRQYTSCP